jgi:uncharacterized protein YaeQ
MALTATMRRFDIEVADSDRSIYETLDLRVAQHPSETDRYLVTRVLARCLEHAEGVNFSKGLGEADEPAIFQKDLTDQLLAWIEVGNPATDRLHRAAKLGAARSGARVAIYTWQRGQELVKQIHEAKVHRAEDIAVYAFEQSFLDGIIKTLDRNNKWELSVSGGALYLTIGGKLHEGTCTRLSA